MRKGLEDRSCRLAMVLVSLAIAGTAAASEPAEDPRPGATLFVSPAGNDAWSGRLAEPNAAKTDGPLATLQRARDEIRAMKKAGPLPAGGVCVELRGGRFELREPLALTAADSGTAAAPLVYRSRPGEIARLTGARVLRGFRPVSDAAVLERLAPIARGNVLETDLRVQGIADLEGMSVRQWKESDPGDAGLELFAHGVRMRVARWPNEGYTRIADLVVQDGWSIHGIPGSRTGQFLYEGDRPARWIGEKDLWLHGFWFWDWSDQRMRVERIDPANRTITLARPAHHYGYRKGQWYYALNALCELDQPGEWCLDRANGRLYFWPPRPLGNDGACVSVTRGLVTMNDVSHVTLAGLTLETARGHGITMSGGASNRVHACTLRNLGKWGIRVSGGADHRVVGCDLYALGEGGIALSGGDRPTLTPGRHLAENNHVHHCGRWNPLYQPGITLAGVGLRAAHNLLHDLPHVAIGFTGNEHVIEYNEIHHVVYHANDAGAVYTVGADETWTMRGHEIRYNYLHHIDGFLGRGCMGVYLDDAFSSIHLHGNVFYRVPRAAFIGGGRDNLFENNVFVDCKPAVHVDSRGLGWMAKSEPYLVKELRSLPVTRPPWSTRYPQLLTLLDDSPMAPKGNVVRRNVCSGGTWDEIDARAKPLVAVQDNLIDKDPRFVDRRRANFQLRDDSPAWKLGFQRIPVEKIGLYADKDRASWPVVDEDDNRDAPMPAETGPLWPDRAPVGDGTYEKAETWITVYLPPRDRATGAAVVICPGGGYIRHVLSREGPRVARWLADHGIAAVVLEYRLPHGRSFVSLLDAQRAVRTVRSKAKAWNVDPSRVGIMGFSAGGHLASTAGTHFDAGDPKAADPIDRLSCRPDFMLLIYPVVTMGPLTHGLTKESLLGPDPKPELVQLFSNEKQVTDKTPPAFLAHAKDDKPVPPENSRMFRDALAAHKVTVEYLELPSGGHGFNGCQGPLWEAWKTKSLEWLAKQGIAVEGQRSKP